jgi:uncharacterized protein
MSTTVDSQTNPELTDVVRRLVEQFHPEQIYLFGSQARNRATEDSDYDIMVVVPESDLPSHQRAQQAYSVWRDTRLPVEVIVFTREQFKRQVPIVASLAATVEREGILLYER